LPDACHAGRPQKIIEAVGAPFFDMRGHKREVRMLDPEVEFRLPLDYAAALREAQASRKLDLSQWIERGQGLCFTK
jgi:hypothetical protein